MLLKKTNCEQCMYYAFDEESGYYICEMDLDEDEMRRFLEGSFRQCHYYHDGDEYSLVRKQN